MSRSARDDALAIWQAGVRAVRSDELVRRAVTVSEGALGIGGQSWKLDTLDRIEVVGAGKAGAGMAAGLEGALGPSLLHSGRVRGWVNVPADCFGKLHAIELHAARPAGRNEPSPDGLAGSEEILRRVQALGPSDLCLCLISGGGSALLPAPMPGLELEDLVAVTRSLSAAGANIEQLNAVRKRLSAIQGGRLAEACRAGWLVSLIISDVIGDPLEVIASGPTVIEADPQQAARRAVEVVEQFQQTGVDFPAAVLERLAADVRSTPTATVTTEVTNLIIGNLQTAIDAAADEAQQRGYATEVLPRIPDEATAEQTGRWLAERLSAPSRAAIESLVGDGPHCWISGGEPVVKLVAAERRGRGGRNQQLVLAALCQLLDTGHGVESLERAVILSGGTDGEDGPTDAAGALLDASVMQQMLAQPLDPAEFLERNDAYSFFDLTGGLIRTGPTHTNVGDVRIVLKNA